ncbi:hypothetical protein H6792_00160 [Candidatus Nomurabacteria bacterium]|nr:hypothetical protein [Candidatus Nomurabacteria bacterium]
MHSSEVGIFINGALGDIGSAVAAKVASNNNQGGRQAGLSVVGANFSGGLLGKDDPNTATVGDIDVARLFGANFSNVSGRFPQGKFEHGTLYHPVYASMGQVLPVGYTLGEKKEVLFDGQPVTATMTRDPNQITGFGFGSGSKMVVDATGAFKTPERVREVYQSFYEMYPDGIVMITCPWKLGDSDSRPPLIVSGAKDGESDIAEAIDQGMFSASSCTTNAVAPVLGVVADKVGVDSIKVIGLNLSHAKTNSDRVSEIGQTFRSGSSGASQELAILYPVLASNIGQVISTRADVATGSIAHLSIICDIKGKVGSNDIEKLLREAMSDDDRLSGVSQFGKGYNSEGYRPSTKLDVVGSDTSSVILGISVDHLGSGTTVIGIEIGYDNVGGYSSVVARLAGRVLRVATGLGL